MRLDNVLARFGYDWRVTEQIARQLIPFLEQGGGAFFVLDGRSGGQDAHGGTAASEELLLRSTKHATPGIIRIADRKKERIVIGADAGNAAYGIDVNDYDDDGNQNWRTALDIDLRRTVGDSGGAKAIRAISAFVHHTATSGSLSDARGLEAGVWLHAPGGCPIGNVYGIMDALRLEAGTVVTTARLLRTYVNNAGTITTLHHISVVRAGGTITDNYGVYIEDQSAVGSGLNYAIRSLGGEVYHTGKIRTDDKYNCGGTDGVSGTFQVITDVRDNAGTIEKKTRSLTYTGGIITTIGTESGWSAI